MIPFFSLLLRSFSPLLPSPFPRIFLQSFSSLLPLVAFFFLLSCLLHFLSPIFLFSFVLLSIPLCRFSLSLSRPTLPSPPLSLAFFVRFFQFCQLSFVRCPSSASKRARLAMVRVPSHSTVKWYTVSTSTNLVLYRPTHSSLVLCYNSVWRRITPETQPFLTLWAALAEFSGLMSASSLVFLSPAISSLMFFSKDCFES